MGKHLTLEQIRQRTHKISDCELLSTEYKGNRLPLRFRCSCGAEFERTWNDFQDRGRTRCNTCAKERQYAEKRLTNEQVEQRLAELGCEWVSGEYVNQKSRLTVVCRCGHMRTGSFTNIVDQNPSGLCVSCARSESQKLNIFGIEGICETMYGIECLENTYIDAHTPMRFRCSCGRVFTACWNNVHSGGQRQCPDCAGIVSRGESEVRRWLDAHNFSYEMQKRFPDCRGLRPYPFDFYLQKERVCIEFDGRQHYEPLAFGGSVARFEELRARDAAKDAYCAAKGMRMIRIPYRDFSRVDEILTAMLIPR